MMKKGVPEFRAEIIGSFIRPTELLAARKAFNGDLATLHPGVSKPNDLIELENDSIRRVVELQQDIGLRVVTDGEFRRIYYYEGFLPALGGIEPRQISDGAGIKFRSGFVAPRIAVVGRLAWPAGGVTVNEFRFLKSVSSATPKITLPSPLHSMFYREGLVDRAAYPEDELLWADLVEVYARELAALADAGCTYVQLDETTVINRWAKAGVWLRILEAMAERSPRSLRIDNSIVRAHQHAAGGKKGVRITPLAVLVEN